MKRVKMPVDKALEMADMKRPLMDRLPSYNPDSIYCPIEQACVTLADEVVKLRRLARRNLIVGALGAMAGSLLVRLIFF